MGVGIGAAETPDRAVEGAVICGLWVPYGSDEAATIAQAFYSASSRDFHSLLCCLLGPLTQLCDIYVLSHGGRWFGSCCAGGGVREVDVRSGAQFRRITGLEQREEVEWIYTVRYGLVCMSFAVKEISLRSGPFGKTKSKLENKVKQAPASDLRTSSSQRMPQWHRSAGFEGSRLSVIQSRDDCRRLVRWTDGPIREMLEQRVEGE